MKVVFFGTPAFAVPTLEALAAQEDLRPAWVISQPSRPVGRGRKIQAPPVAERAAALGLPLAQPESVRDADFLDRLRDLAPDAAVVVAYGQIFRKTLLGIPRLGCINLHGSLLPKYRGAAPIQASIAAGDTVTGVTTMRMERGLDSGPMLMKAELQIGADETAPELSERLSVVGADLMVRTLHELDAGELEAEVQDHEAATFSPRLTRQDAEVNWALTAAEIYNRWRGYFPWPGLASGLTGEGIKLVEVRPLGAAEGEEATLAAGTFCGIRDGAMRVTCGGGTILGVLRLQRAGKKALAAADFVNGERLSPGERFAGS